MIGERFRRIPGEYQASPSQGVGLEQSRDSNPPNPPKSLLDEEYDRLDMALAYWGDEKLHDILRSWYKYIKSKL